MINDNPVNDLRSRFPDLILDDLYNCPVKLFQALKTKEQIQFLGLEFEKRMSKTKFKKLKKALRL